MNAKLPMGWDDRGLLKLKAKSFYYGSFAILAIVAFGLIQVRTWTGAILNNIARVEIAKSKIQSQDILGSPCGTHKFDTLVPGLARDQASSIAHSNVRAELWLADLNWLEGNCDAALDIWHANSGANPPLDFWSNLALGEGYYALGERDRAVEVFKQTRLAPFLYAVGNRRQLLMDWSAAVQLYQLTVEVQPTSDAVDRLVEIYTLLGDQDAIRTMWQNLAANADAPPEVHWLAGGELALLKGDWGNAVLAYKQALSQSDLSTPVRYNLDLRLGRTLQRIQRYPEAIQAYQDAIRIAPAQSSEPYRNLGEILALQGDASGSERWFRRARELFLRDPLPDIHQGILAVRAGRLQEAKRLFSTALAISPSNVQAMVEMSNVEEQLGNTQDATMYLERANSPLRCDLAPLLLEFYRKHGAADKASVLGGQITRLCSP